MNYGKLPKCELHVHLEGAAPPNFIRQLANEKKINLTSQKRKKIIKHQQQQMSQFI